MLYCGDLCEEAKNQQICCLRSCGVRRLDAPIPRERHEIFAKIYSADRRGELRSPAFRLPCRGAVAERLRGYFANAQSNKCVL